jgi:hypothetical protein
MLCFRIILYIFLFILKFDLGFGLRLFSSFSYREYKNDDKISLKVNKIFNDYMQPSFAYYKLPVCRPDRVIQDIKTIGHVISGDSLQTSIYDVRHIKYDELKNL